MIQEDAVICPIPLSSWASRAGGCPKEAMRKLDFHHVVEQPGRVPRHKDWLAAENLSSVNRGSGREPQPCFPGQLSGFGGPPQGHTKLGFSLSISCGSPDPSVLIQKYFPAAVYSHLPTQALELRWALRSFCPCNLCRKSCMWAPPPPRWFLLLPAGSSPPTPPPFLLPAGSSSTVLVLPSRASFSS